MDPQVVGHDVKNPSEEAAVPDVFETVLPDRPQVTYNWKDITKEFIGAASDLNLGELLHDANFGLFEAMSAIEMMDPKMDAGMVCNQLGRKVLNFEQSIEAGQVKVNDFTLPEMIGIVDATLSCMATWLEGHSLAQTLFTNLYTHNPDLVEDRHMKGFTLAVLKMVDIIMEKVTRANVFEEEDFQTMTYGFKLAPNISEQRIGGMLREVEDDLNRKVKGSRVRSGVTRSAELEKEHELGVALQARIKFCRLLYMSLLSFGKKEVKSGVEEAKKLLQQTIDLLPIIKQTIPLGIQPQVTNDTKDSGGHKQTDHPLLMGFEPLVNQRLLPPTFPRYAKIVDRTVAMDYFRGLLERLQTVCEVIYVNGFHSIIEFVAHFSQQSPCVLSRSILQLVILPHNNKKLFGSELVQEALRDSIKNFVLPPFISSRSQMGTKDIVDGFLLHSVRPLNLFIQTLGHNRARQRDKIAQVLEEMANLQDEAEKVDTQIHAAIADPKRQFRACYASWVMYHTLRAMITYLLLGFELELYATHEYHYIYWYLSDFLFAWYISTLNTVDGMLQEHEAAQQEAPGKNRSNKKKKNKKKSRPYEREITLSQGLQTLCVGYYKAVNAFMLEGKISRPAYEFDNERVRFEHRFSPFAGVITPPLVQYEQYNDICDLKKFEGQPARATDFYFTAHNMFVQSVVFMEKLPNPSPEILTFIRIAKTNSVVMKILIGGHKRDSKVPPEFDFSIHNTFPIIKLR